MQPSSNSRVTVKDWTTRPSAPASTPDPAPSWQTGPSYAPGPEAQLAFDQANHHLGEVKKYEKLQTLGTFATTFAPGAAAFANPRRPSHVAGLAAYTSATLAFTYLAGKAADHHRAAFKTEFAAGQEITRAEQRTVAEGSL